MGTRPVIVNDRRPLISGIRPVWVVWIPFRSSVTYFLSFVIWDDGKSFEGRDKINESKIWINEEYRMPGSFCSSVGLLIPAEWFSRADQPRTSGFWVLSCQSRLDWTRVNLTGLDQVSLYDSGGDIYLIPLPSAAIAEMRVEWSRWHVALASQLFVIGRVGCMWYSESRCSSFCNGLLITPIRYNIQVALTKLSTDNNWTFNHSLPLCIHAFISLTKHKHTHSNTNSVNILHVYPVGGEYNLHVHKPQ